MLGAAVLTRCRRAAFSLAADPAPIVTQCKRRKQEGPASGAFRDGMAANFTLRRVR